jgi:hypothetical protein
MITAKAETKERKGFLAGWVLGGHWDTAILGASPHGQKMSSSGDKAMDRV